MFRRVFSFYGTFKGAMDRKFKWTDSGARVKDKAIEARKEKPKRWKENEATDRRAEAMDKAIETTDKGAKTTERLPQSLQNLHIVKNI